jgi:hypothetical protein
MNLERLHRIIRLTTIPLPKGDIGAVQGVADMQTLETMVTLVECATEGTYAKIDMVFFIVAVAKALANSYRDDLIALLDEYPEPDRLIMGPSYLEVGATIGDANAALRLFALGKVLDMWEILTPGSAMGMEGEAERAIASSGFILMTGWPPKVR